MQDLALPLLPGASRDALRYASAALSMCETEPPELIARLADMSVDIAAPLLARAKSLSDIELINLIGRHGLPHARVIASRTGLHPSIRQLTEIVEARDWRPAASLTDQAPLPQQADVDQGPADALEETRERLRSIMRAARDNSGDAETDADYIYEDLREHALAGNTQQLAASLANALGVVVPIARSILRDASCALLTPALRTIGLAEEEAFLIASALFPNRFPSADAIRNFLRNYRSISFEEIDSQLTRWQETSDVVAVRRLQAG